MKILIKGKKENRKKRKEKQIRNKNKTYSNITYKMQPQTRKPERNKA